MELATPITIHWDLPPASADGPDLQRILAGIIECRPLMLQLRDPGPELGAGTVAVLERLKGTQLAVHLTIPPPALNAAAPFLFQAAGLREILLAVERLEQLPLPQPLSGGGGAAPGTSRPVLGISFAVTRWNWREVPALFALCRQQGMTRLVLPMQRLYRGETPFFLDREQQRELAGAIPAAGGSAGLELTIHDPFLWRCVNPGVPFPQGGCQAGNTMLAIAPGGEVYPCPSLPASLGDATATPLRQIAASAGKRELRRRLLQHPRACRDCRELGDCRGGCRGRSYASHGCLDEADAACG